MQYVHEWIYEWMYYFGAADFLAFFRPFEASSRRDTSLRPRICPLLDGLGPSVVDAGGEVGARGDISLRPRICQLLDGLGPAGGEVGARGDTSLRPRICQLLDGLGPSVVDSWICSLEELLSFLGDTSVEGVLPFSFAGLEPWAGFLGGIFLKIE